MTFPIRRCGESVPEEREQPPSHLLSADPVLLSWASYVVVDLESESARSWLQWLVPGNHPEANPRFMSPERFMIG